MLFKSNGTKKQSKIERLFYKYRNLMFREAYFILNDSHLAEDAVSESFIRILNNLNKIDEDNIPRTRSFLVIICRNVAKDIYKKRKSFNEFCEFDDEVLDTLPDSSETPLEIVINNESVEKLTKAIEDLKPIYRDALLMTKVHGFSTKEAAEIFDIPQEALKKRITRAKQQLLEKLKKEECK